MKKNILVFMALLLCVSGYLQARTLSPTFSIRYEDFVNSTAPSAAIGLKLDVDGDRYTGFQVNSDGTDTRLLMGWNWGVIGVGAMDVSALGDGSDILAHYTFGVGYEILDGPAWPSLARRSLEKSDAFLISSSPKSISF